MFKLGVDVVNTIPADFEFLLRVAAGHHLDLVVTAMAKIDR
jgi:hypothetical protein